MTKNESCDSIGRRAKTLTVHTTLRILAINNVRSDGTAVSYCLLSVFCSKLEAIMHECAFLQLMKACREKMDEKFAERKAEFLRSIMCEVMGLR